MPTTDKTYDKGRLISEAYGFLGVPSYVATGALIDAPDELTVAEAKELVSSWLGREINQEAEEG